MTFKDIMSKVGRIMLCGGKDEKRHSLEIGSPMDVRHLDVGNAMPGLSNDEIKMIREKSSHDVIRLLSLQSHPPTQPSSPSTPFPPYLPCDPSSQPPSPTPSATLLNNASVNLPTTLPTPPPQKHSDTSPPSFRMKSMWARTRRLSSLGSHHGGYKELNTTKEGDETGVLMVDLGTDQGTELDIDVKEVKLESPVSRKNTLSLDGFKSQDTVGGAENEEKIHVVKGGSKTKTKEIFNDDAAECSSSDSGESSATVVAIAERSPLVRA
ncbi:hypothetical protein K505DRAFT_371280 [Melanomma pulvis-pyrius CBS 109.77]|uniref:Uncharacterized protein n=1 Tax=Melanomma pulvis-pyrius CBS 109.77 TaxID=1314802 RepID=A0A6A6XTV1_9PLEO|nr:hypothetical protein K505DRAFT_371280 [Melanomma pulvis-pyrius CBS 109.77]